MSDMTVTSGEVEPAYVLCAHEFNAPGLLRDLANDLESDGADPERVAAIRATALQMVRWRLRHGIAEPPNRIREWAVVQRTLDNVLLTVDAVLARVERLEGR